ncbi:hypothetical protein [Flavobacterium sp.]|jgi:hypothetical protein|uniref:hypothetical protein n=1 Tax=Flavobacterium sp. TaxID=239 RepID=UPI0037C00CD3
MNDNIWKDFINTVLLESKQFEKISSETVGETYIEKFRLNKNPQTEIIIGYISKNLLIYFNISNPTVPGYNKYCENEFFYKYDFDDKESYGNPGLDFTEINKNGILSILKNGLKGKEIQFLKNNKVLKSEVYLSENEPNFHYSFYFKKRSLI